MGRHIHAVFCRDGQLQSAAAKEDVASIITMRHPVHSFERRRFILRTPGGRVGEGMAFTRSKLGQDDRSYERGFAPASLSPG